MKSSNFLVKPILLKNNVRKAKVKKTTNKIIKCVGKLIVQANLQL